MKTTKTMVTQAEKEKFNHQSNNDENSRNASIVDPNTDDSALNETDETEPKSMFNVFRKFITTNFGMAEEVDVSSTNFWPQMIEKCGNEF